MTIAHDRDANCFEPQAAGSSFGADELFDPVLRALVLCDGIGRDKTIAVVLSAVERAFPQ